MGPPQAGRDVLTAALRVRLLGPFEVEGVDAARLGSRKARLLLKLLATARGDPVPVDRIAAVVWGERGPAPPPDQVAVLVSRLRSVLGAERIVRGDAGYALRADWFDLTAAGELVDEARRRLAAGSAPSARAAAEAALALVRGTLVADEPDAGWLEVERAAAERLAGNARRLRAVAALAAGDAAGAAEAALDALDRDGYDEEALRVAMAALAAAGRRASALALFEQVRTRIADELGVDPAAATVAAHLAVLKGDPVPGVAVGSAELEGLAVGAAAELPGRAEALRALDAALGRARAAGFAMVGVEGEAGIGKTRLLATWAAQATRAGVRVLNGRCDELGRTLPLQAVLDAVSVQLRGIDAAQATALLGPDRALLAPLIDRRAVVDDRPFAAFGAVPDPGSHQAVLFGALTALLERMAASETVALLIDDLHLAGPATFDWLRSVLRRPPSAGVLLVTSRRSGEGPALDQPETIELGPLDLSAVAEIVGSAAAPKLSERSGGNPLFLVELARAEPGEELPASLRAAVAERCDRSGAAATTLRTAAVLGPEVDLELLATILRVPPVTLLDHLEDGVRRHFLETLGPAFVFRHALVREALVAGTGAPRRALIHREAARALAERPASDPLTVAYHARAGGDGDVEAAALIEAARIAARRFAYDEATALADRSVALRPGLESLLERARIHVVAGRMAAAGADADAAVAAGAGAPALEVAGFAAYYRRDFPLARRLAERGLHLAPEGPTRAALLVLAARERHAVGDLREAERLMEEAVDRSLRSGIAAPAVWLGLLRTHQGRATEALDLVAAARGQGGALAGHLFTAIHTHFSAAIAYGSLGRCAESFAELEALDREIERRQATRFLGRPDNIRGWQLRNLGDMAHADECNLRGLDAARRIEYVEAQAHALLDLADGSLAAGELAAVRRRLDEVAPLQSIPHAFAWRHEVRMRLTEGRLRLAEGMPEEAAGLAAAIVADCERLGIPKYATLGAALEARARSRLGEPVDLAATESLLRSLDTSAGLESWWVTAEAAHDLGVERWWALAEERVAALAARAGDHGGTLRAYAARRLGGLRTAPPGG